MQTLETDALTYSRDDSDAILPAASAALALAAYATGGDPRAVGATQPGARHPAVADDSRLT